MKILVIGPSPVRSKGGMATVIEEIVKDKKLNEEFEIDVYESYIDGNKLKVLLFSVISWKEKESIGKASAAFVSWQLF